METETLRTEGGRTVVDEQAEARDEHPVVELRVYRNGELALRQLFESEEQAGYAMEAWADLEGVEFTLGDLSVRHGADDILEDEPGETWREDDYAAGTEEAAGEPGDEGA